MQIFLNPIIWVNTPGYLHWTGEVGKYTFFELTFNEEEQKFTLESIFYPDIEKAIYSFFTFEECEKKAYLLLQDILNNIIKQESPLIKRTKLNEKR